MGLVAKKLDQVIIGKYEFVMMIIDLLLPTTFSKKKALKWYFGAID